MPTRYVAFLRAINVGGRVVKMADLTRLLEELGLRNVRTVLASGNVTFEAAGTAAAVERRIAAQLAKGLGYEVATFVRTPAEVADVVARVPFTRAEREGAHAVYVGFLQAVPAPAAARAVAALADDVHRFVVDGREVYWLAREGQARSKMSGGVIERALGLPATFRNLNTVERLSPTP